MLLDDQACYQALVARDARFDGRFFVGVTSTDIYCRPICRVRVPMQKNCTFHASAAAAEAAGYRPCMRCRPELAPGFAATEATAKLARKAALLIEEALGDTDTDLETLAKRLGVTSRHLRRAFQQEFGVSPIEFAQTHRLLLAKRLLTDTDLPVTHIAFASGFSSVRRMNALFLSRYRMAPSALRKKRSASTTEQLGNFRFLLPYRPPYDWQHILQFLQQRSLEGVELVNAGMYARTLRIDHGNTPYIGAIRVAHLKGKHAIELMVDPVFAKVLPQTLAAVRRVFDLASDPHETHILLTTTATAPTGLRLPGAFHFFEIALRAIVGQQVTVAAARTVAGRIANKYGAALAENAFGVTRVSPSAETIAAQSAADIAACGMPLKRASAVVEVAKAIVAGSLVVGPNSDHAETTAKLMQFSGIGPWTASYIAMRYLSWPDAWLPRDVALLKALQLPNSPAGEKAAQLRMSTFAPWRSYAVLELWNSLASKPIS